MKHDDSKPNNLNKQKENRRYREIMINLKLINFRHIIINELSVSILNFRNKRGDKHYGSYKKDI